ncbi:MAG: hypothetical protein ACRDH9_10660 [Actinomycetota bacterium]
MPEPATGSPAPLEGDATVGEVLRWLLEEAEAESGIYLRLSPGGEELLLVEPRGLPGPDVSYLADHAREIILKGEISPEVNEPTAYTRWLGKTGSKIILLRGTSDTQAAEALRFSRFVIEWLASPRGETAPMLEQRVRQVPGVAWAEMLETDPPTMRVLYAPEADREVTKAEVIRALGPAPIRVEEVGAPATRGEEPRVRLVDLSVGTDDESAVDVLLDWKGQSLRGRGLGRSTVAGRTYASALAVADAMKPLLENEVAVEGLYRADTTEDFDVLVVMVRVAGQLFVGAVAAAKGQEDVSGARAVLDALNRRLPEIAGRSGHL